MYPIPMIVTRFAPSPTGYLHLGHAYSALLNAQAGERFILRMEDIDQTRCRLQFHDAIYEDLHWLGLRWETPVLIQSQHMPRYEAALEQLRDRELLYRCFKSRKDIEEAMSAPHAAPGQAFTSEPDIDEEAKLAQGLPFAWRLSMAKAVTLFPNLTYREEMVDRIIERPANPEHFGDVVLGRKESGTSYHLASVLDDAMQGITHIIRGEELREAAGLHVLLQRLLGLPSPVYRHHGMLTNEKGERLSKRDGAFSLRAMKESGMTPQQVRDAAFTAAARSV